MMSVGKKARHGQSNAIDRLSDLPDSILHQIISFLGSDESCQTSILSKRWIHVWSTGLILDFKPHFFHKSTLRSIYDPHNKETIFRFVNFVETTMRRYSDQNISIKKFKLEYPTIDQGMARRIDRWLGIAVQNQFEALSLSIAPKDAKGPPSYCLPVVLFSAKSLISMECRRVRVSHCQDLKLFSIQSLELWEVHIDEHMLQHIILSCPLKKLKLRKCSGIKNISIPHHSRLEALHVSETVPIGGTIMVDTSTLRRISYQGINENSRWPFIFKPASKKNLSFLCIIYVSIMENIVDKLVPELPSIKKLTFYNCDMPMKITIASQTLEELCINDCYDLVNIAIDAPKLETFCYTGDLQLTAVNISHSKCDAYLHLTLDHLDTEDFRRIKRLLYRSSCCKVLSIIFSDAPEIEFNKDLVTKFFDGLPYEVQKLKLSLSFAILPESSLIALIDGLFWSCRPDMLFLSITIAIDNRNTVVKSLLDILKEKVKCWKHPLKRTEIKGADCSNLSSTQNLDLQVKLYSQMQLGLDGLLNGDTSCSSNC